MASLSSIGNSGLQAAQLRLDTSAHNVANLNTPGFRRQVVEQTEAPGSNGVQASVQRDGQVGSALEKDVVEQMSATYAFKANVQVIKTNDQMMGALLNTKA
ncbi:flagellar basal body protein [Acidovorax sp. 106]|uniref:flagellar basal body protein n=1 Tax=Acidovorax sp. 106 TaxID=2135637 RepID=UPI000EB18C0B|nr:flagellar basal body protein [Acidovorax sp. 106]RLJ37796.1 flagellar basal body rod protein [Acidovorax sp. 106]